MKKKKEQKKKTKIKCSTQGLFSQEKALWAPYGLLLTASKGLKKLKFLRPTFPLLLVSLYFFQHCNVSCFRICLFWEITRENDSKVDIFGFLSHGFL